jgi:hypothetical protein
MTPHYRIAIHYVHSSQKFRNGDGWLGIALYGAPLASDGHSSLYETLRCYANNYF